MKIEIDMSVSDHLVVHQSILRTREEVERLIETLRKLADLVWPKDDE